MAKPVEFVLYCVVHKMWSTRSLLYTLPVVIRISASYKCITTKITIELNLKLTEHACGMGLTQHVLHFMLVQACVCMHG